MNSPKKTEIILKKHLSLWAFANLPHQGGRLIIKKIAMLGTHNNKFAKDRKPQGEAVAVEMYRPTPWRLYALECWIKRGFYTELSCFVEAYRAAGKPGRDGAAAFLAKYDISEDVYSRDTAYRMYYKKIRK